MKFKSTLIALSVSALLFSGMGNAAITGTGSVEMTIKRKSFQVHARQKYSTVQAPHLVKLHLEMSTNRIW